MEKWSRTGTNAVPLGDVDPLEIARVELYAGRGEGVERRLWRHDVSVAATPHRRENAKGEAQTCETKLISLADGPTFDPIFVIGDEDFEIADSTPESIVFPAVEGGWPHADWERVRVVAVLADGEEFDLAEVPVG